MLKKDVEKKVLQIQKERSELCIENFCTKGTYLTDGGELVRGVCRPVDVQELINFMSVTNALIIEAMSVGDEA